MPLCMPVWLLLTLTLFWETPILLRVFFWIKCHNIVHNQYFKYVFQKNCHLCDCCCDNCGWSSTIVVLLGQLRLTATIVNIVITSNIPVGYSHKCNMKACLYNLEFGARYNFASSTVVAQCSFLHMISFRCGWMYGKKSQVWPEC